MNNRSQSLYRPRHCALYMDKDQWGRGWGVSDTRILSLKSLSWYSCAGSRFGSWARPVTLMAQSRVIYGPSHRATNTITRGSQIVRKLSAICVHAVIMLCAPIDLGAWTHHKYTVITWCTEHDHCMNTNCRQFVILEWSCSWAWLCRKALWIP